MNRNGSLLIFILIFLLILAGCRPHYDFSKERSAIRSATKTDSLVYQPTANDTTNAWGKPTKMFVNAAGVFTLLVDTVHGLQQKTAPIGALRYDYVVSVKIKMVVRDSTDTGYAGLLFDHIDSTYSRMLVISNKGTFYLLDRCGGEEELLIPKISSRYLNQQADAWNTVEIRHHRKQVHILFNNNLAAICKINKAFSYGEVGLIAATTENQVHYSPVKAVFSQFTVKKIREPR